MRYLQATLLAIFATALPAQQNKYSLKGQVVFDNGMPVAGAVVTLSNTNWHEVGDPVLTDGQGRFAISGLGEATYIVTAQRNDLGTFTLGESPQRDSVTAFTFNEKFPFQEILFRIDRPGTITGTVRDSAGNLMAQQQLTASRRSWSDGKTVTQVSGSAVSDEAGHFRLSLLHPGRYRLCAEKSQEQPVLPVGYAVYGQKSLESYSRSCVPDSPKTFIVVGPGTKVETNIVLSQQVPVEVSGSVANLPEAQQASVQLEAAESSDQRLQFGAQTLGSAHEFTIKSVAPGAYWLSVEPFANSAGSNPLSARISVTVGDSGLSGIKLTLEPRPVINVMVHAPKDAGEITIGLRDAGQSLNGLTNAERQPDGSLRIALPHAGRYWLVTREEFCPLSASFGKADAMRQPVTIPPGATGTLEVTITSQCGAIEGVAIDRSGKPVPFPRALILMSGSPEDPGDMMLATGDEDGLINYTGLTPGKYYLWTWTQGAEWDGEVGDLGTMRTRQTMVEIKAGEKRTVNVPVIDFSAPGAR